MATLPISISQFAGDPNLLNTSLWPKQAEILEDFWTGGYSLAVWALGRRSGKTLMSAVCATYAATMLADAYRQQLRRGERFYIVSVANSLDQSRIALQAVKDLISGSPILKRLIESETADSLELTNGAVFRAMPSSSRSGRGMACPLLIMDEAGHYLDTSGNSAGDSLYAALAPSVAQFGSLGKILVLSSPWLQQGLFWQLFEQASSGQHPDMQVVNLPTWEVNPTISQDWLAREKARDPDLFAIEFGANFSMSLSVFLSGDLVEAAIAQERSILSPCARFRGQYYLGLDPAKGNRDRYTACICHYDSDRLVVDRWHEFTASLSDGSKRQVNIAEVEDWILEQHSLYRFRKVVLDQYNSQSTIQRLTGKVPISELTWTAPSKTTAFSKLRELFNSGKIELYPHFKANQQIKNLTVRYRSNGTWDVSGGTGAGVDDYPAALAAAVLSAEGQRLMAFPVPKPSPRQVRNLLGTGRREGRLSRIII